MITIIKEGNKIKCSQNTYETMYKRLGYTILDENKKTEVKKVENLEDKTKEKTIISKERDKEKTTKSKTKKGE